MGQAGINKSQLTPQLQAQLDQLGVFYDEGKTDKARGAQQAFRATAVPMIEQMKGAQQQQDIYKPYQAAGDQALEQQMALLGLRGDAAMQSAYGNNPAHAFAQQQMEQGLMRNASAMGGLRGSDVQRELAQYTSGLTNQNIQNQLAQLGGISSQGYNAAQNIGQGYTNMGQIKAGNWVDSQSIQSKVAAQQAAERASKGSGLRRIAGMVGGALQLGSMIPSGIAGFQTGANFLSGIGQPKPQAVPQLNPSVTYG
jgi:hypothetical protein